MFLKSRLPSDSYPFHPHRAGRGELNVRRNDGQVSGAVEARGPDAGLGEASPHALCVWQPTPLLLSDVCSFGNINGLNVALL